MLQQLCVYLILCTFIFKNILLCYWHPLSALPDASSDNSSCFLQKVKKYIYILLWLVYQYQNKCQHSNKIHHLR
jgi:hypothetical protein